MRVARGGRAGAFLALTGLGGCGGYASMFDAAGPQAARIETLSWFLIGAGSAVWVVVVGTLLWALHRARRRGTVETGPAVERKLGRAVGTGVAVAGVVLAVVLLVSLSTGRALATFAEPDALTIRVTGHQWWWQVEYVDPEPNRRLTTANEIVVPVGRQVRLLGEARDVIHSFWAPNLHGKLDLIPGYSGGTSFRVDEEGVYRGRCAEFCGLQHAHMDFRVIAVPPDSFAAWYAGQLEPAAQPTDPLALRGQEVFLGRGCVLCHTVRGTPAGSRVGPDLTHLASRTTLASGILPNTRGHLAGWVLDPQSIKPGVRMPPNQLPADELRALLAYLEGLR